jgi:hypothetical protein
MKATYQIIGDEAKLREFIDWLPELTPDETYYVSLFARNKYCKETAHIKQDKQQLKRFTCNKKTLFNKLAQLEVKYGAYTLDDGSPIPQEALAVYIAINPRSFEKATKVALKQFVDLITRQYSGYNPHQIVLSTIAKKDSVSRRKFYDFDFDDLTFEEIQNKLEQILFKNSIYTLKTRGGYHLLVDLENIEPQYSNNWYNTFNKVFAGNIDNKGTDTLIPIPGCYQGGFIPTLTKS